MIAQADGVEKVDSWTIAEHEAGHAVMRWLLGWPRTALTCSEDAGFCAGTGLPVPAAENLLYTVAGMAVETGYGLVEPILAESRMDDLDRARRLVEGYELATPASGQRLTAAEIDKAVHLAISKASEMLCPHGFLIEEIAWRLRANGQVSARSLAAIFREYRKRDARSAAQDDVGSKEAR